MPPAPEPARAGRLGLLALALLALVAHGRSLAGGFVYDDRWTVLDNPVIRDPGNLTRLLGPEFGRAGVPDAGRPLLLALETLDWALFRAHPRGWHAHNLLWHLLVVALVLALARRWGFPLPVALLGAALFAVHPLGVEPVAAINYREDLLAAAFVLLALAAATRTGAAALVAVGCATLAGLLAKENAAVTPLLIGAVAIARASEGELKPALRRAAPAIAAAAAAVLLVAIWRRWVFGAASVVSLTAEIPALHRDPLHTVPRAALGFLHGIRQLLTTTGLAPEYPDLPPGTLTTALGLAALAAVAAVTLALVRLRVRLPEVALGWLFAVVAYLPHFGLVPLTNLRADRYFYLPLVGLALALAGLALRLAARVGLAGSAPGARRWGAAVAAVTLAALAVRAARQGRIWHDDRAVFAAAAASDPGSQRARLGLAAARLRAGETLGALAAAEAALALGESARARQMRGLVLLTQGDAGAAVRELERALALADRSERAEVLHNLGLAAARAGDAAAARRHLAAAIAHAPRFEPPVLELARLEQASGNLARGRAVLEAFLARVPESVAAWRRLAKLEAAAGRPDAAAAARAHAARLDH